MKSFFLFLLLVSGVCFGGQLSLEVRTNKKDSVFKCGETIEVSARLLEDGKPVSGLKVEYKLEADGGFFKRGKFVSTADKPFVWKHKFDYPAALRAEFVILDRSGKKIKLKRKRSQQVFAGGVIGAVAEPEKIQPSGPCPEDFEAFWNAQKKRLAQVPLKELERKAVTKISSREKKLVNVWDIKVSSVDNVPVSGYLSMPKNAKPKSLPAILRVQGAGVGSAEIGRVTQWSQMGAICLEINAHGVPNGMPKKYYQDLKKGKYLHYYTKVYPSREKHIFLNIALRVCRALEYLRSLPEWDGKNLIIRGASQGGWQAVLGAALDPQVTLCIAGVPAFADFDAEFSPQKRMPRIHFGLAIRKKNPSQEALKKMLQVQSYFDPVHFAPQIKCPVFMTVGYVDLSCPTTSVYAIYNRISQSVKKHIDAFPEGVHATCPVTAGDAELKNIIERSKK